MKAQVVDNLLFTIIGEFDMLEVNLAFVKVQLEGPISYSRPVSQQL